jgi:hypothetical protein
MLVSASLAQPPADPPVAASAAVALVLALIFWPVVRYGSTMAHEGGHAFTASLFGGRVSRITIRRGGGGRTNWTSSDAAAFVATLAGYLGPSVFGLFGALLLVRGHVTAVLWLSVVLLFAALLLAGTWWTRLTLVVMGALIVFVLRTTSAGQQTFFAYTWVWFLLIAGFGDVLVLQNIRSGGKDVRSDAYKLRTMTYLPASLWSGLFWIATLATLVIGGAILFGAVRVW